MIDPAVVGLVSAVTALVASIVGPLTTLHIGRSQIRAAVLSANRQKWIDGFRDLVSSFSGQVAVVAHLHQTLIRDGRLSVAHDPEVLKQFERLVATFTKIKLMTNPADGIQVDLLAKMQAILTEVRSPSETPDFTLDVEAQVAEIATLTQTILRREWERVKHLA